MKFCTVGECFGKATRKGLCQKHYWRVRRHGDTETVMKPLGWPGSRGKDHPTWRGDKAANSTVHFRVASVKGKASQYSCVECGGQAEQWAYQYGCPDEKQSTRGPYSLDISKYEPMCCSCHKYLDNEMSGRTAVQGLGFGIRRQS